MSPLSSHPFSFPLPFSSFLHIVSFPTFLPPPPSFIFVLFSSSLPYSSPFPFPFPVLSPSFQNWYA